ncbi:MAG: ADP-ribosylglycohydrolase family protein, partial [Candidatus Eremiobacterota bacterium]
MRRIFQSMLAQGRIPLRPDPWLETTPPPLDPASDRVEGMLLGLAVGDALGRRLESLATSRRTVDTRRYPGGRGKVSDDTQLAFWTLEHLLEQGEISPRRLAERFAAEPVRGLGRSLREFVSRVKDGKPWYECAPGSAGNGALMRIAPVLLPHLRHPGPDLWADTALAAVLTHRDGASVSSCLAYVHLLWELLRQSAPPSPAFYLDTFLQAAERLEPEGRYRARGFEGRLCDYVRREVTRAWREDLPARAACDRWGSGPYLMETVPCLIYLLMRHGQDPGEAVVRAVNDTYDADTLGALVGAAVGALHGKEGFDELWLRQLDPRISATGPTLFQVVDRALQRWAPRPPSPLRGGASGRPSGERRAPWDRLLHRLGALETGRPVSHGDLHLVPLLDLHAEPGRPVTLLNEALE